jgi:hypothetical protein
MLASTHPASHCHSPEDLSFQKASHQRVIGRSWWLMIVKEEQWIWNVTVAVKSMIGLFMMTVMIKFRYEGETLCRVIGTADTSIQMASVLNVCSETSVPVCEYLKIISRQRISSYSCWGNKYRELFWWQPNEKIVRPDGGVASIFTKGIGGNQFMVWTMETEHCTVGSYIHYCTVTVSVTLQQPVWG